MARSKYPNLNRLLKEVQEIVGVNPVDGLIGPNTEQHLARVLKDYDGNDVLGYLGDYLHKQVEESEELPQPTEKKDEPIWLAEAKSHIGLKEIVGKKHNEEILEFWRLCGLPFKDDETPWCAGFVGGVLEKCGIRSTRSGMARSYLNWGKEIKEPRIGAILVFWRNHVNSSSGHVGFLADYPSPILMPVLGGNQGNQVCVKRYPRARLLSMRWID